MTDAEVNNLVEGRSVSHYRILDKLGAGGMGEVYLAEDTRLERPIALKILPADFAEDADRMRRFVLEAKATSALNHPNIITIYEIGEADGVNFIAAEFIDGETLRERMKRRLTFDETLSILIQTAEALSAAHRAGIVHRDIKPENIMIRADGYAKVLDFGLAKLTEKKKTDEVSLEGATKALIKTHPGMVMGTVSYMSPEQTRGKETDARTDVWSLGVVLYEMLAGKVPFQGETVNHIIVSILEKEPLHLANAPNELQRIVRKSLSKDVEMRYQTAHDLLIDLKNLRRDLDIQGELERAAVPNRKQTAESVEENATQIYNQAAIEKTQADKETLPTKNVTTSSSLEYAATQAKSHKLFSAIVGIVLLGAISAIAYFAFFTKSDAKPIESIAVMPFVNESGNADVEYLSDGMTETLISSLSQLPNLNVKARSSVFRYKGKETNANTIGKELNVQAIVHGRVVQRGQDLILYVELVDAATENSLWKQTYNKTMSNLVALKNDIARDVADKLKLKLSGADERRLAKNYTANAEAYQLYLRGRYHILKATRAETQTGILYFQQAIAIDPNYALAYVGLADAYRWLSLAGEIPSIEVLPKSRAAARKAIEIDDRLAEAHAALGYVIFLYDWDWNAAENQYRRALELDPNSADTHQAYAYLLSNTGRHAEALAEIKRARELDPLHLRTNALEGQFLIHAGQTDEALTRLQKTFELEPNFWLAHLFAASAYIEKGMFSEAEAKARKAQELTDASTHPAAFLGYTLAKSGEQAEARSILEHLLKLSTERYVSPYNIALIYNGLEERDETLAWLERGYRERTTLMVFLKVEPKWNNLRDDPRFEELLRKVGFTP